MEYEVVQGPFILYETVDMLYKYVNGLSFRSLLNQRVAVRNTTAADWMVTYAEQLQQILDETCADINPKSPDLRRYFSRVDTGDKRDGACLARFMVFTCFDLKETDFQKNVEQIRANWHHLQRRGARIKNCCAAGLSFTYDDSAPEDLLDQICALDLPPEFQLNLYRALRDLDGSLDELVALIRPTAQRLEKIIRKADWILEERIAYWRQMPVELMSFLSDFIGEEAVLHTWDRTTVAVSLMNFDFIVGDVDRTSEHYIDRNYLYFGCLVNAQSAPRDQSAAFSNLSATLKTLCDKKRLELLSRLSKDRSYCQELAETMGMDPSNMSRNLAMLYNYGFLRQEREAQKNYYRTDPEAVRSFLRQLENALLT